jgi:O-acetyl-ADP-ribose deacetylase (regulator of RNase III)
LTYILYLINLISKINYRKGLKMPIQRAFQTVNGQIGQNRTSIVLGDITESKVDALIVPQFTNDVSYGGVGGAVARSGALAGMQEYDRFIQQNGRQNYGTVLLSPSGSPKFSHLLHVVSVGSGEDKEFSTVQNGFFNALKLAEAHGLKSIAAPALGTGIIGDLTAKQSAEAMMSSLKAYGETGGKPMGVEFVIYGDRSAFTDFVQVMNSGSYNEVNRHQTGEREFDPVRWADGFKEHARTERVIRGPNPFKR